MVVAGAVGEDRGRGADELLARGGQQPQRVLDLGVEARARGPEVLEAAVVELVGLYYLQAGRPSVNISFQYILM